MYKLYKTSSGDFGVQFTNDDGSQVSFLQDPDNTDYQQFLRWCEEGNQPLPADDNGQAAE